MTGLLNRPGNWLFFLKKIIQVFIATIPNTGSKGVCVCVFVQFSFGRRYQFIAGWLWYEICATVGKRV